MCSEYALKQFTRREEIIRVCKKDAILQNNFDSKSVQGENAVENGAISAEMPPDSASETAPNPPSALQTPQPGRQRPPRAGRRGAPVCAPPTARRNPASDCPSNASLID